MWSSGLFTVKSVSHRWRRCNKTIKKTLAVILAALLVGFFSAAIIKTYLYPQIAILTMTPVVSIMIEDVPYVNGSTIDWGILDQANTTYALLLNVSNIGATPCTVTFTTTGLPTGWTQTWAGNNTLLAVNEWVAADMELTTGFTDGNYSWNTYIHAEA